MTKLTIICDLCGEEYTAEMNAFSVVVIEETTNGLRDDFRNTGWALNTDAGEDLCPHCQHLARVHDPA